MARKSGAKSPAENRISIGYTQSGSYDDDDYYYLVFDAAETSAVIQHSWHYWRPGGNKEGTEELTLEELKKEDSTAYREATKLLSSKGFPPNMLKK